MAHRPLLAVGAVALAVGLGACQYLHAPRHWAKVTPVAPATQMRTPVQAEDALYTRATVAIQQRDYGLALDVLQLAREDRPSDARVLTAMGVVYDKLGRFDLSHRYYDLAEAADPGSKIVAADLSYSAILQGLRTGQPSPAVAAAARAPVAVTAANTPNSLVAFGPAPILRIAAGPPPPVRLIGRPLLVQNASGDAHGADLIEAQLSGRGWTLERGAASPGAPRTASRVRYPASAAPVAMGLAHTLLFSVKLEACDDCTRVELVIGTDAVLAMRSQHQEKAQRG